MSKTALQAPYGRIAMEILKRKDLTTTQKLIYGIISAKQGESDFAKLSTKMISEALDCTTKTASLGIATLKSKKLIDEPTKGEFSTSVKDGQFGMVELDFLIATNISTKAKYLYLIYCASSNDYDVNFRGRSMVCSDFRMSNTTYQFAHSELLNTGILIIKKQASGPNTQTANINLIKRAEKCKLSRPASWIPQEAFDLDKWCESNFDENGDLKEEISVLENGNMGTQEVEVGMQRSVTINSNLNTTGSTNEGIIPSKTVSQPGDGDEEEETQIDEAKIALFGKLAYKKSRTVEAAMKILTDIHDKAGVKWYLLEYTNNPDLLKKAFVAFDAMRESLEEHGVDTSGYGLDCDDLTRFLSFNKRHSSLSDDRIIYHVKRVVQLGIEREGKSYIAFSYLFSEFAELKQEPFVA
ncbi:MAG: hypothetical protein KKB74_12080 [Bacteroidetes bacterium]|nr:hypothetical protein [Bacteroidota bacterium]